MKTVLRLALLLIVSIAILIPPAPSRAADVCYTDGGGNFYTFTIKPACHATSDKVSILTGRIHLSVTCGFPAKHTFALHGTCFGSRASNEVRLGFTSEIDSTACYTSFWELRGSSTVSTLTGTFRNLAGSFGGAALTPANCATAPAID